MSDADDQMDELLALASIYDDSVFSSETSKEGLSTGVLKASVELQQPFHVTLAGKGLSVTLGLILLGCPTMIGKSCIFMAFVFNC